jgi:dihydrofolate synthase / folylpolyglutamate synthase
LFYYFCAMFARYEEALKYLYDNAPIFQRIGAAAYKADLNNTIALLSSLGNPEKKFKSVHIAGTNGKGSSSHMIASILQSAGYKTGLYTSPHLKEFTERIRINGVEVDKTFVVEFVNKTYDIIERIKPSFFEITVAMAFEYFATRHVDIAVIEVGLGGRLDSTNVITPIVSLITNISNDHKDLLGDTLEKIAGEKAGIIKPGVPVVVSELQQDTMKVFIAKAGKELSPIYFAEKTVSATINDNHLTINSQNKTLHVPSFPLRGIYQQMNVPGVMKTIEIIGQSGFKVTETSIISGLQSVVSATGLKGRWQTIGEKPLIICDTGHNEAGIGQILEQLKRENYQHLFMVLGMVKDKDISGVLRQLPRDATYFFCEARIPRAMPAAQLTELAGTFGLKGTAVPDVNEAIEKARRIASENDLIFVGGSTFVVAEINGI